MVPAAGACSSTSHILFRNSLSELRAQQKAILASERTAQAACAAVEKSVMTATWKLLSKVPPGLVSAARPLMDAFQFDLKQRDQIERAHVALSLLLAPFQDVLLVGKLADVSTCAPPSHKWCGVKVACQPVCRKAYSSGAGRPN